MMCYPNINLGYLCRYLRVDTTYLSKISTFNNWLLLFSAGGDSLLSLLFLISFHKNDIKTHRTLRIFYLNHQQSDIDSISQDRRNKIFDEVKIYLSTVPNLTVEWLVYSKDVSLMATKIKQTFERTASLIRNKIILNNNRNNDHLIISGHNLSDWYETLLMRINRGCSLDKIIPFNILNIDNDVTYLRPLALTSRDEVRQFLDNHTISYWNDPTNNDTNIIRNKIRINYPILNIEGLKITAQLFLGNLNKLHNFDNHIQTISYRREYHLFYDFYESLTIDEQDFLKIYILRKLGMPGVSKNIRTQLKLNPYFKYQAYNIHKEIWNKQYILCFRRGNLNIPNIKEDSINKILSFIQTHTIENTTIILGTKITSNTYINFQYGKKKIKKIYSEQGLSYRQRENIYLLINKVNPEEVLYLPLSVYGLNDMKGILYK